MCGYGGDLINHKSSILVIYVLCKPRSSANEFCIWSCTYAHVYLTCFVLRYLILMSFALRFKRKKLYLYVNILVCDSIHRKLGHYTVRLWHAYKWYVGLSVNTWCLWPQSQRLSPESHLVTLSAWWREWTDNSSFALPYYELESEEIMFSSFTS